MMSPIKGQQESEGLLSEEGSRPVASTWDMGKILKYGSLLLVILQNSSHVLLLRWSRIDHGGDGDCNQYVVSPRPART